MRSSLSTVKSPIVLPVLWVFLAAVAAALMDGRAAWSIMTAQS